MASTIAVPTALGLTSLVAAGTFGLSFAVDPAETVRLEYPCGIGPCIDDFRFELERNSDCLLRSVAAALLVPIALLAVASKRTRPNPTAEVN